MTRDCFQNRTAATLPADLPPQLLVVIDTEEEFDWNAEPDSAADSVDAMAHVGRVQDIFNDYGICPCYVVDYPVASKPEGYRLLKQFADAGQCEIGAHLHPWVTPPVSETLSRSNMYPGNLPAALEKAKLQSLRDTIADNFGTAPVAYKAGRYGFGPNTPAILRELGFTIDLSVCPPLDSRADGGPDYRYFNAEPFFFGADDPSILELPCTGEFVGWANGWSVPLFEMANRLKRFKVPGILSRLGAVDRLMLSPEGFSPEEHIKLTRFLLKRGVRTFTWSFHSPSVVPGNTTYVKDDQQLREFLDSFRRFFDFFFNDLGGQASSPSRLRKTMERMA
ncbi:polysaccharide deacetylase family protein [Marinobacter xestospongiae]|uniref:Polysaccharide deacetylase family protein n=1 Tax=Marinobacter xestospongiae TaxID=994319 RepID=A0ABU3VZP2_9GAMM|nr:polysaccharide deacetylase family protein [Marinobacter xestospongiae]MDV2079721.1 polysaccharide deacetylase family protein [Marinobacter xestospongiae]